jgi:hypothetical protein
VLLSEASVLLFLLLATATRHLKGCERLLKPLFGGWQVDDAALQAVLRHCMNCIGLSHELQKHLL